ncbi:MAG: ATP-dependent sacrificial sulfur transferase LarE [Acidimicrobiales bacterium]
MTALALKRLEGELGKHQGLVVGFSGGADSALLAFLATRTLGRDNVACVTAVSASLAHDELEDCRLLASEWALDWQVVQTDELANPSYVANGPDRCYHCKAELMSALEPLAAARRATIALGVNLDDLGDHRPGQTAASERGAAFPLVEAAMTKSDVREVSALLGLRTADKPAAACLASRLPYGTPVSIGVLASVGKAEECLRRLGFAASRVRHYGDLARVELPLGDLERAIWQREEIVEAVKAAGYRYVTLDLEGLRSGNLNAAAGISGLAQTRA